MWEIDDRDVLKWLRKNKGNALARKRFKEFVDKIESLPDDGDPMQFCSGVVRYTRIIKEKIRVAEYELTDSYRLLYTVHYENKIVRLAKIGDHKETLGKG